MSAFYGGRARPSDALQWATCVAGIQFVIGAVPYAANKIGFQFLPSPKWANAVNIPAWTVGILYALLFVWLVYAHLIPRFNRDGFNFKSLIVYIAGCYLWLFLGWCTVAETIPIVIAAYTNNLSFVTFVVSDATKFGYRGCRSPVDLQNMPALADRICNVSSDLRKTLAPGSVVVVIGHGTWRGVFVERVSKAG